MEFEDVQNICAEHGIKMTKEAFERMKLSVAEGKYTYDQVGRWLDNSPGKYRDVFNYRDMFKEIPAAGSVNDVEGLQNYAEQLQIEIPEDTFELMKQSVRVGEHSPSQLANYLRGSAYHQFLQSADVPNLSEAEHATLRVEMSPQSYEKYSASLQNISRQFGLPQPAVHQIATELFADRAEAVQLFDKVLSEIPVETLERTQKGIKAFAEQLGLYVTEEHASFYEDATLPPNQLKAHFLHCAAEQFSNGPEGYAQAVKSANLKQEDEYGLEL